MGNILDQSNAFSLCVIGSNMILFLLAFVLKKLVDVMPSKYNFFVST